MTCWLAPLLSTMFVLCTVQTMPMSPLTVASSSRMSTLHDSKLAKVSSNNLRAGATPRDANGGMSNHSTSDAQCRVLCAPDIDSAISRTMDTMASLSCSVVVMVLAPLGWQSVERLTRSLGRAGGGG